ncbi:MAG: hypothetical protein AAB834_01270, partial [Patescibacteria group bacterium]
VGHAVPEMRDMCAAIGAPLGVLEVSTILEDNAAPIGSTVAHLWYPWLLSPKPVLALLRQSARQIIAEENI